MEWEVVSVEVTGDQYLGTGKLLKWYDRYSRQYISVHGTVGTGSFSMVQSFIELSDLDPREVMYLSMNQKQILDLSLRGYHTYYLPMILYRYVRVTDISTLSVLNPYSEGTVSEWKKEPRRKVKAYYKLIVVLDGSLVPDRMMRDLSNLGRPVIVLTDPSLVPLPDSSSYLSDPDITLNDTNVDSMKNPIVSIAERIRSGTMIEYGHRDPVTVLHRKQLNQYTIRHSDMNVTLSQGMSDGINSSFRNHIVRTSGDRNIIGERLLIDRTYHGVSIWNRVNDRLRLYLAKGSIVHLTRIARHQPLTRYVGCDVRLDGYHESFQSLVLDRYHLNGHDGESKQQVPEQSLLTTYAYALPVQLARYSNFGRVTVIADTYDTESESDRMKLYTAVTRATSKLTLVI